VEAGELVAAAVGEGVTVGDAVTAVGEAVTAADALGVGVGLGVVDGDAHEARTSAKATRDRVTA
jgi:hypothetical protein